MARPRDPNPSAGALRARTYRERKGAGFRSFHVPVDLELLRARFPDAADDDELARCLEELIEDVIRTA